MKLNLTRENVENLLEAFLAMEKPESALLMQDWLTLEAECTRRGELIGQLERAIRLLPDNPNEPWIKDGALHDVSEWRKEQK